MPGQRKNLEFRFSEQSSGDPNDYSIRVEFGGNQCAIDFVPGQTPPGGDFQCQKPIDVLEMFWNGSVPVDVIAYKGAVGAEVVGSASNLGVGSEVSFSGFAGSPNDVFWEIFDASTGDKLGESVFHLSCSDQDMNGPEDCGEAQGNGKRNEGFLLNDWLLEGMTDAVGEFDCTP